MNSTPKKNPNLPAKTKKSSANSKTPASVVNKTTPAKKIRPPRRSGPGVEVLESETPPSADSETTLNRSSIIEVDPKGVGHIANTLPAVQDAAGPLTAYDQNLLGLYLKEIARTPLLSPGEERALAIQAFDDKDMVAFQKLVQANLRFVVKIAFEYSRYGARILDLVQEGNMGLLKAVQNFNPYKEVRLTTYAVWWIRSYIQDFLLRNWSLVRIGTTAAQKKLFYRLKKEQEKFEREGLRPQPRAIAHQLNVDEADVKLMDERLKGGDLSLSAPLGNDSEETGFSLLNKLPDQHERADDALESSEQAALFKKALEEFQAGLEERDQEIFKARLMSEEPKTLLEIGEAFGFSKERARQIEERLKERLKAFLLEKYPDISLE